MNPAQLERLGEHLLKLRLFKSRQRLEALLQDAAAKELAYSDFLEQVLAEEVPPRPARPWRFQAIRNPSLMRSLGDSTNVRGRHCSTKRQLNDFITLLRRPVASATQSGR